MEMVGASEKRVLEEGGPGGWTSLLGLVFLLRWVPLPAASFFCRKGVNQGRISQAVAAQGVEEKKAEKKENDRFNRSRKGENKKQKCETMVVSEGGDLNAQSGRCR